MKLSKARVLIMLVLVMILVAGPGLTSAQEEYYVVYNGTPGAITCGATGLSATPGSLVIDYYIPASHSWTVEELVNGVQYATWSGSFPFSGTGSTPSGIGSNPFPATPYPYTWERIVRTYVDSQLVSVSHITLSCPGSVGVFVSIQNSITRAAGCPVLVNIPATAVGGAFVADAPLYWTPGQLTDPALTITAGNTALVVGVDASGAYYKILWECQFLWVPVGTMGPNYDAVWNGTPLPTDVVE